MREIKGIAFFRRIPANLRRKNEWCKPQAMPLPARGFMRADVMSRRYFVSGAVLPGAFPLKPNNFSAFPR